MASIIPDTSAMGFAPYVPKDVRCHRPEFPLLLIDDDGIFRELIATFLQDAGFLVQQAASADDATALLASNDYRLIICDYLMPEQNGIDFCRQLRSKEHHYHYLLLLTARADTDDIVRGLQSGADDYVGKSLNKTELIARVDCGVRVLYAQKMLEIQQQKLLYQVQHDTLTGLYNRSYLADVTPKIIAMTNRYQQPVSVLLADLDHFKQVNDQLGHQQGDLVLKTAAQVIQQTLRETDIAVRFGGEEFLIILPHIDVSMAWQVAEKVRVQLAQNATLRNNGNCPVTVSIGVTCYRAGERFEQCIKRADELMYQSKANGRNRCSQGG